ncbi:MAG TPA: SpoIIE family protein phosphatase [Vicinamibacterales bacterium]|jgi:predicted ester cyclase
MTPVVAEGIKAVFARMQEGYARRDAAGIAADYAEDCVVESPIAGVHVGPAAVERELRGIFSAFPDMRVHWDELLISGNRAASIGRTEGTDTGGLMGLPPTGKPFIVSVVMLYTFGDDCKIVRERRMYDFSRLLLHLTEGSEPAADGPRLYRELLERAQHEQELKLAGEIQRALLPQSEYRAPGFEVVASSVPCRAIGGDFFDYFTLSEGAFALVLGDVTGKGPAAALLAAVLQGIFTANAPRSLTPAVVLAQANDALLRRAIRARFATVFYAVLSPDGRVAYCNAGHNAPILLGQHGMKRLESGGPFIGAFERAMFGEETLQLEPGDLLVAFSDGVTEARNADGQEFGEDRLLACIEGHRALAPAALLDSLLDTVQQFSAGAGQRDDLTALVLRYSGRPDLKSSQPAAVPR